MFRIFILIGIFILFFISFAHSEGFWCENRLINIGDTKIEVINKCGPPDDLEVVSYETTGYNSKGVISVRTKKIENLYYNCGERRFIKILTFTDGILSNIKNGGYGTGPAKCD